MDEITAGFEEREHTADWKLHVWGEDLPRLLEKAAIGMNTLAGMQLHDEPHQASSLRLHFVDAEELLVAFLSEILFLGETEGLGFDRFELRIGEGTMDALLFGAPIARLDKEIKAVTYHNLRVEKTPRGLEATIVFDV